MRKRKLINKKIEKKVVKKCRICGYEETDALEYHRIKFGSEGGTYNKENTVIICGNCHTLIHKKKISIDRYYDCTNGKKMLRITKNGKEEFV